MPPIKKKKKTIKKKLELSASSPSFIPKPQFRSQFRNPYKTAISNFFFFNIKVLKGQKVDLEVSIFYARKHQ